MENYNKKYIFKVCWAEKTHHRNYTMHKWVKTKGREVFIESHSDTFSVLPSQLMCSRFIFACLEESLLLTHQWFNGKRFPCCTNIVQNNAWNQSGTSRRTRQTVFTFHRKAASSVSKCRPWYLKMPSFLSCPLLCVLYVLALSVQ